MLIQWKGPFSVVHKLSDQDYRLDVKGICLFYHREGMFSFSLGISKFQVYLEGNEFTIETDHRPLAYINQAKCTNSRVMRWALSLQPFRFRIEAIPGSENVGADFLSRIAK